jgi:hypothetical protein
MFHYTLVVEGCASTLSISVLELSTWPRAEIQLSSFDGKVAIDLKAFCPLLVQRGPVNGIRLSTTAG